MNEPTTADSSTSKHTDMASVMQGKGADTAWTQECRHNNMDTGMQTQHAWWWIVCMQASRCNAMCGVASSVCVCGVVYVVPSKGDSGSPCANSKDGKGKQDDEGKRRASAVSIAAQQIMEEMRSKTGSHTSLASLVDSGRNRSIRDSLVGFLFKKKPGHTHFADSTNASARSSLSVAHLTHNPAHEQQQQQQQQQQHQQQEEEEQQQGDHDVAGPREQERKGAQLGNATAVTAESTGSNDVSLVPPLSGGARFASGRQDDGQQHTQHQQGIQDDSSSHYSSTASEGSKDDGGDDEGDACEMLEFGTRNFPPARNATNSEEVEEGRWEEDGTLCCEADEEGEHEPMAVYVLE